MPSLINEHEAFLDTSGTPIANGKVYIGLQNQDPVANPKSIYSDRALSVSLANPQTLDAYGRASNKIWVDGKYSIRVDDSDDVQVYQNLDAGEVSGTGITVLTNVTGTDTITANGSPAVTSLTDNQQYNFRAANTNTGAVTLQIDLTTAKTIKKLHDQDLVAGDIEANQTVSVIYNATDDVFELVSNTSSATFSSITTNSIAFPSTPVPSVDPNTLDSYIEGATLTSFTPHLNGTESLSIARGSYVKVGLLVFFNIRIAITTIGTGDQRTIYGLPFTASANVETCPCSVYSANTLGITVYDISAGVLANTDQVTITTASSSGGVLGSNNIFQDGSGIVVGGCYIAAG